MKQYNILQCLIVLVVLMSTANADIVMTITDDGTDLTMRATGTYDMTNEVPTAAMGGLGFRAMVAPNVFRIFGWETGVGTLYSANFNGTLTGGFNHTGDSVSTSNPFYFYGQGGIIAFSDSAPLIGSVDETAVLYNRTLATLGMIPGETVMVSWGLGGPGENAIITTSPIPEPTSIALLFVSGVAGGFYYRKKRSSKL